MSVLSGSVREHRRLLLSLLFLGMLAGALLLSAYIGRLAYAGAPTGPPAQALKADTSSLQHAGSAAIQRYNRAAAIPTTVNVSSGPVGATATPTTCPPSTITGSITFDDPIRTETIDLDGIVSTCASPKPCPPEFEGRFNYDPYIYVNNTGSTQCYTVTLDGENCGVGTERKISSSAYLGSFDPTSACLNYLADAGRETGATRGPVTYSFSVPAGATFVVVVEVIFEGFDCLSYDLTVSGAGCPVPQPTRTPRPTVCPPTTVTGAIDEGDPLSFESLDFTGISNCDNPKTCPETIEGDFHYDTYTYMNTNSSPACVAVRVDGTTCGDSFEGIFSASYLGSFDPNSACANYLADPGHHSDKRFGPVDYSFVVPAGASFTVLVQEVLPMVGCQNYTLLISGLTNCLLTPTVMPTKPPGSTATATPTRPPPTTPPGSTATATRRPSTATAVPTACAMQFNDVQPSNAFYSSIMCLACRGIISGYTDTTNCPSTLGGPPCFRWENNVTRGQLSKIVSEAAGYTEDPGGQIFMDVPSSNPFYQWINRLANRQIISGYDDPATCAGVGTPCFRWERNATRGQISKIVSEAARFNEDPGGQIFTDVSPQNPFYTWINRLANRQIISGYSDEENCAGVGVPCFRWERNATRGQTSKIVANAFYPNCSALARK